MAVNDFDAKQSAHYSRVLVTDLVLSGTQCTRSLSWLNLPFFIVNLQFFANMQFLDATPSIRGGSGGGGGVGVTSFTKMANPDQKLQICHEKMANLLTLTMTENVNPDSNSDRNTLSSPTNVWPTCINKDVNLRWLSPFKQFIHPGFETEVDVTRSP